MTSDLQESFKISEVATILNCTAQHVRNLIATGRLEAFNITTDYDKRPSWRISRKALSRFSSAA